MIKVKKIKGKHYLFDLYGCDYHDLDDATELKKLLEGAAHAAKREKSSIYAKLKAFRF